MWVLFLPLILDTFLKVGRKKDKESLRKETAERREVSVCFDPSPLSLPLLSPSASPLPSPPCSSPLTFLLLSALLPLPSLSSLFNFPLSLLSSLLSLLPYLFCQLVTINLLQSLMKSVQLFLQPVFGRVGCSQARHTHIHITDTHMYITRTRTQAKHKANT